jgi:uncharacterized membrane protein
MNDSADARSASKLPEVTRGNIESVTQLIQNVAKESSRAHRLGEAVTRIAASGAFVIAQLLVVAAWIFINTGFVPLISPFDPYPFSLLGVVVSIEAAMLAAFVVMTQRRQSQQTEHWAHLNLQIGLLAEQEATKMLQMLRAISERLGVPTEHDAELREMAEKTVINHLHQELAENLDKVHAASPASSNSGASLGD